MEKIIKINKLEPRFDTHGSPRFHILHEKDELYYIWKKSLIDGVNEGDIVKINFTPGRWKRVTTLERMSSLLTTPQISPKVLPIATSSSNVITRGYALIAAAAAFPWQTGKESIEDAMKRIRLCAEVFELWIEKEKGKE